MQISDILQNEKFKGADPDQQEEILNLYEQAMHEEAFKPGNFNMRQYAQAKQEVDFAKTALNLQPDPRSTFQRMKDEFVNGMSSSMQAAKALRAVNGLDTPEEAAAELAEQERELQARPIARSMLKYQKAGGQGWVAPVLNIFSNPEAAALIAAQGLGSSVPGLAIGAAGSIGTKVAGGGKEAVLLSTMAGVGAGSAFVEGGSKILEDLREQTGDLQDTEAVAAILRDPAKLQEMKNRALARGVTVGAFDAASVALPSSMLFKTAKGLKGLAARGVGDAALQGMLGAAGEVAGSAVIGEESNPADAWAEFIGEMVPGMVELGLGGARTLIPQTEQAAQEKSKTNALFPSQTSAPTIQADKQKGQFGAPRLAPGAVAKAADAVKAPSTIPKVDAVLEGSDVVEVESLDEVGMAPVGVSPEENIEKPKNDGAFTYYGSGFGPFASVAESLAEAQGVKRGGWKVVSKNASQDERDSLAEFDTTENPDEADKNNIDNVDFIIDIANDESLKNDVGQSVGRTIAVDSEKPIIEGRSADVIIPRVLEYLKANPDKTKFTIIGPQTTAGRSFVGTTRPSGVNTELKIREAQEIAREVMQVLGSIPREPTLRDLNTEASARRKAAGMDYARAASPESIVANMIPAGKYTQSQEKAQELLSQFDPATEPTANDRVLVFGTDVNGRHDKVYGPIAQRLGAEKGKTGAVGRTYAIPIFDPGYKGPEGKNNRQGASESFNPRSAKLEMQKFFDFAKQNPGKDFWLMFGAYPHTFSKSQERAMFGGVNVPANVRFLSSTAANIFQGTTAPKSRVYVNRGKKSTRSPSIPNVDRALGEAQALDPNDIDKDLSVGDRISNKGRGPSLRGIILTARQARELLSAAISERVERRRKIVGTPKQGTMYNPAVAPGGITQLSSYPFTAFANSKKGTFLVRIKNISEIGKEVDVQTAAELAKTNPETIQAKIGIGAQYLVDLDFVVPVDSDYRRTISKIYERETEVVTQAKATGQVTEVDADTLLASPQEAARPIGAQAGSSYMSQVFRGGPAFANDPVSGVPVPAEDLAKHIEAVLFDNNPERMRTKSMPALKTLTPQQVTTLQDALNTINAFKPEAKPTQASVRILKEALNIIKDYAENEKIASEMYLAVRDENTYALNQPGTYMKMLAKAIARDPRAGSLANLNLYLPGVGSVSFTPDQVQTFAKGELTGSVSPVAAKFTPADTTGLTEENSLEKQFKPNSLYLYDNKGQVLRVLPFSFRNRFIPNAGGVNIVPDTDVLHPTTSLKAFDSREMSAQKSLTPEELSDLSWAQAKGLLGEIPATDWRGRFALDVSEKLGRGEPVVIADQDTIQFVRAYPGIFTGVVRHGDSIMVTEMKTAFGIMTSESPVPGLSQDFTSVFYRLLQPFFALQENEFNKEIDLGTKEEIAGGGVGSVGDTVPAFSPTGETIPSVNKQLSEGERRFEEGLSDESIPELETQKGAGEVDRGMGGAEYNKLLEPTEGAKEVKSARLNMLISPEKAELIRKADPEGKYVRMVVLPNISYIARTTGKEMPVTTKDGYAIVTGITDPRTGEYMGDKAPLPQRPTSEVTSEEERLQAATAAAAEQDKLGQYVFLPKDITVQDLVNTYQNILNVIKGANGPVLVSRDILEFNQQLQALQNVVSFDATDEGIYITGAYDKAKGEWIGQLPYGARRMTTGEIASLSREQAIDLGNNINEWLREKRNASVDAISLDDVTFSDDEIKNRVLLLQTVAQSYLDGFGKTRESLEKGLANIMSLKTREKQNYLFLENVDARFQQAIDGGAFDPDELRLLPRLIQDAVNVFNSGVVYSPVDTNDTSKGWNAGVSRKYPNTSGRPREHFLSRVKKSGIPEQEANNLVDNLNINQTEAFRDSELMRRVFIETLLKSKTTDGAKLNAVLNKILSEYEDMREQFGDEYLNESRPTNTLYGFVTALSVEGYGGVDGLAKRVVGIAANMKINEVSFVSLEGTTEKVESNETESKTIDVDFLPDQSGNDYDAQKDLAGDSYDTELDKYETLPTKDKRRKKYEAFIQQMAKYRESLPFIQRAVHDIVMREGFGFTSGYRPSMYNGKSNAQLDILFPTVKLKEESQIGDAGKGKGFLSGKLLNSIFGALPGIPSSFIEPAVLSQIARERYEGILQELVRNDMQEFSDAEKVRETLRQYEQEVVDEQSRASQLRKDLRQAGIPIGNKSTPEIRAMNLAANPKRVGSLPKALLNILGNSPLSSLRDTSELLINRLRQQYKFAGATLEQLMEQLIDPVGRFDGTLAPEDLISSENDRSRMRDILFNILLPAFENRDSFDSASVLNQMRAINDPYRRQANLSRVRKIQADVSGASKYATEEGFADAGVSFDLNLLNLQDPRQEQAMEYLRASARRKGLKNVRFQSNTAENYPVFTVRGSDNAMDPVNSTIFVNPELLAEKLFQQKDINFLDPVARNTYDKLTEQLMDQLIAHEVAHLSYFEQLRQEYRARFPNGGVSWESYYNGRVRDVSNFLRSEDNGLKVKLPGQKAVSVTEALGELYPETKQSDEVLVAEFLRLLLELDKSRGAKVFTEGLELQRSLQVQDRVSSLIRGQSRQQVMAMDEFARSQRKSFLGWLRTVLDSVFNLFSTLKASSDPRARELYTTYNKLSAIYDRFYSDYVAPPTVNTPTTEADGLLPMGEAFERARPIGAQREEAAAARRPDIFENDGGVPTYTEKNSPEEIAYLKNIGAIDAVDSVLNQLDADKVAVWLSYNPPPDTTAAVEIGNQTFNLDNPQIFILAGYAIRRFSETKQNHKATMLLRHVSKLGRGMGQTISIAYRLLKQFLLQSPSGMVSEYVSRLAETRGALKNKVGEQLSSLGEEVKQAQGEALGLTLNDAGVQALIKQINDLYGQALKQVNQDDLATIIRNHYAEFSGEELVSVLAKLLPEYENEPLLFELADMVQKNMQTQLGKALSLRGRTLRRNIVNRKGMNNAELRAERIEQLIGEMHEVVKPPISKSGNTIEDAISGDARKILELAALGAINDDVVLSTIESLGKFPSFDVNTAETLRKMMVDASRTPYGFQRDRKFHDALRLLHNSTKSGALPQVSAYWYMSMLSGPATFWMNFISTAIKAIADIATYSAAAATARGNPALAIKYMTLGYKTFLASMHTIALAEAKGILLHGDINPRTNGKYVDEASINALESMGTDTLMKKVLSKGKYIFRIMSASDALFGRSAMEGFAAIQAQIQAIENVEGGLTNLSIEEETARLLNQTDAFVEQATKQAIGEKLTPGTADFTKRVYELRDFAIQADPERATIMRRAEDLSLYSTYNNKPYGLLGHIAEGIGALSREHPILVPLFVPFTKIVSNVTNESINYTPIGAYRAFKAWKEAGAKTTSGLAKTVEQMEQIKKIEQGSLYAIQAVLGTSAMIVLAGLAGMLKDDDDDGQDDGFTITGGGPSDPAARKQAREGGYVPYSFSFGGNSVKLSYLSTPLAIPLSIVGTWFDQSNYPRGREKDMTEKLTSAALAVAQVPFNQSFLQGLSNLFKMLDGTSEGQDVSALQNFFSGAVGNAVPNVLKQADQIFEPIPQQQTSFVGKWLFNKIPIIKSMTGTPQLNVLGEVVNAPAGAERMLFLQRFINTSEADPLFKLLMAKNAFIPDARRGTKIGNYQLNDEQFYKFRELRGKVIAQVVRRPSFFAMAKRMNADQLDSYLQKLGQQASDAAKRQLTPELIRQGVKL